MESIGEKFRVTREQKGYSIEQISRDTNIAKRFLQALESEDFKAFPGEPYVLGFLRNYAEYLGLDPEEITTLYKHMMIQEQPIPMAELIVRKKSKAPIVIILAVIAAAGLFTAGYFLLLPRLRSPRPRPDKAPVEAAAERTDADVYILSEEIVERRFSEGQVIQVTIKERPYRIVIEEIGEKVTLALGRGKVQIRLGQEENLDLDGDTGAELKVFLRDIDAQANAVVLRFDRFLQAVVPGNLETAQAGETETNGTETPAQSQPLVPAQIQTQTQTAGSSQPVSTPALGTTTVASRKRAPVVLKEADAPSPFTVSVVFRGYCLVRYIMDGQIRDERYFHKGETFELKDVEKEVRFWISNAGSFKAKIAGIDTDLGKPGEVATNQITWIRDEQTGKYRLTIVPVY